MLLSLFCCVLFLELITKIFLEVHKGYFVSADWRSANKNIQQCYKFSEKLGFEPIPDKCKEYDNTYFSTKNSTHILGATSKENYIILALGDSITHRGSYTKELENYLNKKYPEKYNYQVINAGVEAYNTAQEVELLKSKLLALNPKMVILQFCMNDFESTPVVIKDNNKILFYSSKKDFVYDINPFLFEHSNLYRYFIFMSDRFSNRNYQKEGETSVSKSLDLFKDTLEERKIPYGVIVYPLFDSNLGKKEHATIIDLLKAKQINYLDLLPKFQAKGKLDLFASSSRGVKDILHPNNDGKNIANKEIIDYIENIK